MQQEYDKDPTKFPFPKEAINEYLERDNNAKKEDKKEQVKDKERPKSASN